MCFPEANWLLNSRMKHFKERQISAVTKKTLVIILQHGQVSLL
jgi:hypothetical protein